MTEVSIWVPIVVALIGLVAVVVGNIITTRSSNAREVQLARNQVEIKEAEFKHAERSRLAEQKHAAYAELLRQISLVPEAHYKQEQEAVQQRQQSGVGVSIHLYSTGVQVAGAQAKLVSSAESQARIDDALGAFF